MDKTPKEDTFRKEYKPLSEDQKKVMNEVKTIASDLKRVINAVVSPDNGREMAIAKTNLETAIMWAVKGITK